MVRPRVPDRSSSPAYARYVLGLLFVVYVFNFIDRQKVRRIPVDASLRERLTRGEVIIVRCEGRYDLVPPDIGAKIREREARAIVSLDQKAEAAQPDAAGDDP